MKLFNLKILVLFNNNLDYQRHFLIFCTNLKYVHKLNQI